MSSPVWISAVSPLFQYSPTRNGPVGAAWMQDPSGAICAGPQVFAVELQGLYCTFVVLWIGFFVVYSPPRMDRPTYISFLNRLQVARDRLIRHFHRA